MLLFWLHCLLCSTGLPPSATQRAAVVPHLPLLCLTWASVPPIDKHLRNAPVRRVADRQPRAQTGPGAKNTVIFKWVTHMFSLCHGSPTVKLPARNVHASLPEHCAEIRCCQNSIYLCSCHKELLLYFSLIERQVCSGAQTGSNQLCCAGKGAQRDVPRLTQKAEFRV